MIRKYIVDVNTVFNKSIILTLLEKGEYGFHIEGLTDSDTKDLFPAINNIRYIKNEIDISCIPSRCYAVYLDEEYRLKALLLLSKSKKYYLFKVDHQKDRQLNIHQKYISVDVASLMLDYEKHCKNKGQNLYQGEGNFSLIKDVDYFEYQYHLDVKNQVSKESSIYKLIFHNNNLFTADFISLVENKIISIISKDKLDKSALTLLSMQKNKSDRRDCLLIDSVTKDIKYFIFTYKPSLVKHFLLFKNLGNDTFEFLKETTCFNELFALTELKDIRYRNGSELSAKSFEGVRYDNFFNEYITFEEEEAFDEEIKKELDFGYITPEKKRKDQIVQEVLSIVKKEKLPLDIPVTLHGQARVNERIGEMNEKEMMCLAKVAYEKGLTSAHYIEKDTTMFNFLQYQQNKIIGKTLRFYKDILFFFTLEPPHSLVTCFFYQNNYETYLSHKK